MFLVLQCFYLYSVYVCDCYVKHFCVKMCVILVGFAKCVDLGCTIIQIRLVFFRSGILLRICLNSGVVESMAYCYG